MEVLRRDRRRKAFVAFAERAELLCFSGVAVPAGGRARLFPTVCFSQCCLCLSHSLAFLSVLFALRSLPKTAFYSSSAPLEAW